MPHSHKSSNVNIESIRVCWDPREICCVLSFQLDEKVFFFLPSEFELKLSKVFVFAVSAMESSSHHNFELFMRLWHCYIIRVYDVHVRNNFFFPRCHHGDCCWWYVDVMRTVSMFSSAIDFAFFFLSYSSSTSTTHPPIPTLRIYKCFRL